MSKTHKRVSRLQKQLKNDEAILVSNPTDIFYFTDITPLSPQEIESLLVVAQTTAVVFCSPFTLFHSDPTFNYIPCYGKHRLLTIIKNLQDAKIANLYLDTDHLPASVYLELSKTELQLKTLDENVIWQFRIHKDSEEINAIKKASNASTKIIEKVSKQLQPGITEKEVANELLIDAIKLGYSNLSFPSIVAFGPHTASPHHIPSDQKLVDEVPVLIDFGVRADGYCSDMTRTFWYGKHKTPTFSEIEQTVHKAYDAGLHMLKQEKKTAREIDNAVRGKITKAGYAKEFLHTSGHGLGLDIHEPPSINGNNDHTLEKNTVITIEPGIYLKNKFGYRYENTILIDTHVEELTKTY